MRYATPGGLRSLVEDLATGLDIGHLCDVARITAGPVVDGQAAPAAVLAMPDPQAQALLARGFPAERVIVAGRRWEPVLAMLCALGPPALAGRGRDLRQRARRLDPRGRRRAAPRGRRAGARRALDRQARAARTCTNPPLPCLQMLHAVSDLLGIDADPEWANVVRWSLAAPIDPHPEAYHLGSSGVGLCGDGWIGASEQPRPRVEAAFLSGRALGQALVGRLTS